MPERTKKQALEMHINNNLPVLMVDTFNINTRQDNIVLVRLLAHVPEGLTEQARFMAEKDKLKSMLDLFADVLGYYPVKKRKHNLSRR
jgi:hypothetical protein